MDLTVIVQTCPRRREAISPTLESLRASDIGERFTLLENPEGVDRFTFFRQVLVAMGEATTPYVLRLEDDVVVNQHVVHNALSWPALSDPLFGAGWLFVPQAALSDAGRLGQRNGMLFRDAPEMWGCLAVLTTPKMARDMVTFRDGLAWQDVTLLSQDRFLSLSTWKLDRRVFLHQPSLVENRFIPTSKRWGEFTCRKCGRAVETHPPDAPSYTDLRMMCVYCGSEELVDFRADADKDPVLYGKSPYPRGMGSQHHLAGPLYKPTWKRGDPPEIPAASPQKAVAPQKQKKAPKRRTKWGRRR